jgi:hypothetical protein
LLKPEKFDSREGSNVLIGSIPKVARLNLKVGFPVSSHSFSFWELVLSATSGTLIIDTTMEDRRLIHTWATHYNLWKKKAENTSLTSSF